MAGSTAMSSRPTAKRSKPRSPTLALCVVASWDGSACRGQGKGPSQGAGAFCHHLHLHHSHLDEVLFTVAAVPGRSLGVRPRSAERAGRPVVPRLWAVGHSGQALFWMTSTKSPRWNPGTKWASTSALTLPKVVSRRSLSPSVKAARIWFLKAQVMVELGISKTQIAAQFEVSRPTLYTALRKAGAPPGAETRVQTPLPVKGAWQRPPRAGGRTSSVLRRGETSDALPRAVIVSS